MVNNQKWGLFVVEYFPRNMKYSLAIYLNLSIYFSQNEVFLLRSSSREEQEKKRRKEYKKRVLVWGTVSLKNNKFRKLICGLKKCLSGVKLQT